MSLGRKLKAINSFITSQHIAFNLEIIWIVIWIAIWIAIHKMYPFTRDILCSIQQITSHCCSFFSPCYTAIHLKSGLKLSRIAIQIECLHGTKFLDPDHDLEYDL